MEAQKLNTLYFSRDEALSKTVFDICTEGNLISVEKALKSYKSSTLPTDLIGSSPLHYAAKRNKLDIAHLLLQWGHCTEQNKIKKTPLHLAAQEGHLEMCNLLLQYGCDVNLQDMMGMSPLHWAVSNEHLNLVTLLMEHGADVNLLDKFGRTPLSIVDANIANMSIMTQSNQEKEKKAEQSALKRRRQSDEYKDPYTKKRKTQEAGKQLLKQFKFYDTPDRDLQRLSRRIMSQAKQQEILESQDSPKECDGTGFRKLNFIKDQSIIDSHQTKSNSVAEVTQMEISDGYIAGFSSTRNTISPSNKVRQVPMSDFESAFIASLAERSNRFPDEQVISSENIIKNTLPSELNNQTSQSNVSASINLSIERPKPRMFAVCRNLTTHKLLVIPMKSNDEKVLIRNERTNVLGRHISTPNTSSLPKTNEGISGGKSKKPIERKSVHERLLSIRSQFLRELFKKSISESNSKKSGTEALNTNSDNFGSVSANNIYNMNGNNRSISNLGEMNIENVTDSIPEEVNSIRSETKPPKTYVKRVGNPFTQSNHISNSNENNRYVSNLNKVDHINVTNSISEEFNTIQADSKPTKTCLETGNSNIQYKNNSILNINTSNISHPDLNSENVPLSMAKENNRIQSDSKTSDNDSDLCVVSNKLNSLQTPPVKNILSKIAALKQSLSQSSNQEINSKKDDSQINKSDVGSNFSSNTAKANVQTNLSNVSKQFATQNSPLKTTPVINKTALKKTCTNNSSMKNINIHNPMDKSTFIDKASTNNSAMNYTSAVNMGNPRKTFNANPRASFVPPARYIIKPRPKVKVVGRLPPNGMKVIRLPDRNQPLIIVKGDLNIVIPASRMEVNNRKIVYPRSLGSSIAIPMNKYDVNANTNALDKALETSSKNGFTFTTSINILSSTSASSNFNRKDAFTVQSSVPSNRQFAKPNNHLSSTLSPNASSNANAINSTVRASVKSNKPNVSLTGLMKVEEDIPFSLSNIANIVPPLDSVEENNEISNAPNNFDAAVTTTPTFGTFTYPVANSTVQSTLFAKSTFLSSPYHSVIQPNGIKSTLLTASTRNTNTSTYSTALVTSSASLSIASSLLSTSFSNSLVRYSSPTMSTFSTSSYVPLSSSSSQPSHMDRTASNLFSTSSVPISSETSHNRLTPSDFLPSSSSTSLVPYDANAVPKSVELTIVRDWDPKKSIPNFVVVPKSAPSPQKSIEYKAGPLAIEYSGMKIFAQAQQMESEFKDNSNGVICNSKARHRFSQNKSPTSRPTIARQGLEEDKTGTESAHQKNNPYTQPMETPNEAKARNVKDLVSFIKELERDLDVEQKRATVSGSTSLCLGNKNVQNDRSKRKINQQENVISSHNANNTSYIINRNQNIGKDSNGPGFNGVRLPVDLNSSNKILQDNFNTNTNALANSNNATLGKNFNVNNTSYIINRHQSYDRDNINLSSRQLTANLEPEELLSRSNFVQSISNAGPTHNVNNPSYIINGHQSGGKDSITPNSCQSMAESLECSAFPSNSNAFKNISNAGPTHNVNNTTYIINRHQDQTENVLSTFSQPTTNIISEMQTFSPSATAQSLSNTGLSQNHNEIILPIGDYVPISSSVTGIFPSSNAPTANVAPSLGFKTQSFNNIQAPTIKNIESSIGKSQIQNSNYRQLSLISETNTDGSVRPVDVLNSDTHGSNTQCSVFSNSDSESEDDFVRALNNLLSEVQEVNNSSECIANSGGDDGRRGQSWKMKPSNALKWNQQSQRDYLKERTSGYNGSEENFQVRSNYPDPPLCSQMFDMDEEVLELVGQESKSQQSRNFSNRELSLLKSSPSGGEHLNLKESPMPFSNDTRISQSSSDRRVLSYSPPGTKNTQFDSPDHLLAKFLRLIASSRLVLDAKTKEKIQAFIASLRQLNEKDPTRGAEITRQFWRRFPNVRKTSRQFGETFKRKNIFTGSQTGPKIVELPDTVQSSASIQRSNVQPSFIESLDNIITTPEAVDSAASAVEIIGPNLQTSPSPELNLNHANIQSGLQSFPSSPSIFFSSCPQSSSVENSLLDNFDVSLLLEYLDSTSNTIHKNSAIKELLNITPVGNELCRSNVQPSLVASLDNNNTTPVAIDSAASAVEIMGPNLQTSASSELNLGHADIQSGLQSFPSSPSMFFSSGLQSTPVENSLLDNFDASLLLENLDSASNANHNNSAAEELLTPVGNEHWRSNLQPSLVESLDNIMTTPVAVDTAASAVKKVGPHLQPSQSPDLNVGHADIQSGLQSFPPSPSMFFSSCLQSSPVENSLLDNFDASLLLDNLDSASNANHNNSASEELLTPVGNELWRSNLQPSLVESLDNITTTPVDTAASAVEIMGPNLQSSTSPELNLGHTDIQSGLLSIPPSPSMIFSSCLQSSPVENSLLDNFDASLLLENLDANGPPLDSDTQAFI